MNKKEKMNRALDEMIEAGQKMIHAATVIKEIFAEPAEPEAKETVTPEEPKPKPEPQPAPEAKTYTFQEVRGIMATLSGKGMKDEAKALLTKYGANRLSAVKEDDYSALVADAEALLNG